MDWMNPGVRSIIRNSTRKVKAGDILLLHASDSALQTARALPFIIRKLANARRIRVCNGVGIIKILKKAIECLLVFLGCSTYRPLFVCTNDEQLHVVHPAVFVHVLWGVVGT